MMLPILISSSLARTIDGMARAGMTASSDLRRILFPPRATGLFFRDDCFLDVAQTVLAEVDLVIDEESWRTEGAAADRPLGLGQQLVLDLLRLRELEELVGGEVRFDQSRLQHRRVVELLGVGPHVSVDLVDIALEDPELAGGEGAAHDHQRDDRKERVHLEARDAMLADEAFGLELLILRLVLDADIGFGR